jgi:hypothetical protein
MSLPANWTTVPVTWTLTGQDGVPCNGVVRFTSAQIVTASGGTYVPKPIEATVTNGVMASVSLPSTDDPDIAPTGWTWQVLALVSPAGPAAFNITVPASTVGSINLATVVPVTSPTPVTTASLADSALALVVGDTTTSTRQKLDATYSAHEAGLSSWPTFVYGNSYGILAAGWFTSGGHYSQKVATALGGGSVTSYAISGKRILDVLSALVNEAAAPGLATAPVAGGKWPGTSSRNGLVILESLVNDIGHYPSMVGTALPAALPTANTRYKDCLQVLYRTALALLSSESRVEQSTATYSGTWTQNTATGYVSNGTLSFTSAAGAFIEYSVTPPQSGPLAGKVFVLGYTVDPAAGTMAQQTISVDGTAQVTRTPSGWEQYTGPGGGNVNVAWDVTAVQVPIDGAAHLVRIAHSGSAGQLLYSDCVIVPSTDPDPIIVPGAEHTLTAPTLWNAAQRGAYHDNARVLIPLLQAVVAEFPNAVYVPSTMTTSGLYSGDGIHPNDRGMAQRANDILRGVSKSLRARLESRSLALQADNTFGVL